MLFGINILGWFLGGGWKWIGGAALLIAAYIWGAAWLANYHHLQERAKVADQVEAQLKDEHGRLEWVRGKWHEAQRDRDSARAELRGTDKARGDFFAAIGRLKNDGVQKDPRCWPADDDRSVRNGAWEKLSPGFGSYGDRGKMPAVP